MKALIKYLLLFFAMCHYTPETIAQINEVNEGYIISDATVALASENTNFKNFSKKALIIFPESENLLYVRMSISNDSSQTNYLQQRENLHPELLLKLTFPVVRKQIQESLTSSKRFNAVGHLLMNNINREVKVAYMPLLSGTEEDGNFNISIIVQFDPCDFNVCTPDTSEQLIINIKNAVVNRI